MKYYSTRDKSLLYSLKDAAVMGLAPDGGLFMPQYIPKADIDVVFRKAEKSFPEMASYLAWLFMEGDVDRDALDEVCRQAFGFDVRLSHIEGDKYTLELFHGPTFAFKDFGAGFMGRMLGVLNGSGEDLTILTATSGDTGSAVANGFYCVPGVKVVVLYPEGKVSDLQESQMTTLGGNILSPACEGKFRRLPENSQGDFQRQRFFRAEKKVTSANSINILRWLPQSFYYFYGWYLWNSATGKYMPEITVAVRQLRQYIGRHAGKENGAAGKRFHSCVQR